MSEAGHVKLLPQLQLNVARQESGLNIARVHVLFFFPGKSDIWIYIM